MLNKNKTIPSDDANSIKITFDSLSIVIPDSEKLVSIDSNGKKTFVSAKYLISVLRKDLLKFIDPTHKKPLSI